MDLFLRLLIRMSKWSRRPPSRRFILTVAVTAAIILVVAGIEHFIGWPEALTVEGLPRRPVLP
jgi:hypothetical protein